MENRSLYHAMTTYALIRNLVKILLARFFCVLATSIVGMSLGSLAASYGLALWIPLCLSIFVLAGTAEFIFIGFLAVGGSPIAAAIAGLLVNLRHLPFGIAVNELIRGKFSLILGLISWMKAFCLVWHSLISKPKRLLTVAMWHRSVGHSASLLVILLECYSRP